MASILSDSDIVILKALINKSDSLLNNGVSRSDGEFQAGQDQSAPDVYVALPPSTGIPACAFVGTSPGVGDQPGYADCQIFQLLHVYPSAPQLISTGVASQRVYNLSSTDIPGDSWLTVQRTKDGVWLPVTGGGKVELFHGVIIEPCDETCSTYLVQRVHRYLIAGCEACTGTGTSTTAPSPPPP